MSCPRTESIARLLKKLASFFQKFTLCIETSPNKIVMVSFHCNSSRWFCRSIFLHDNRQKAIIFAELNQKRLNPGDSAPLSNDGHGDENVISKCNFSYVFVTFSRVFAKLWLYNGSRHGRTVNSVIALGVASFTDVHLFFLFKGACHTSTPHTAAGWRKGSRRFCCTVTRALDELLHLIYYRVVQRFPVAAFTSLCDWFAKPRAAFRAVFSTSGVQNQIQS